MADMPPPRIERLPLSSENERESPLAKRKGKRLPRPEEEPVPDVSSPEDDENKHELDTLA
jgi:hypothetical protein